MASPFSPVELFGPGSAGQKKCGKNLISLVILFSKLEPEASKDIFSKGLWLLSKGLALQNAAFYCTHNILLCH